MNFNIIGKSKIFVIIGVIFVIASWVLIGTFGLNPGIDLQGGTQWRLNFDDTSVDTSQVHEFFESDLGLNPIVKTTDGNDFIVEIKNIDEATHQEYANTMESELGSFTERSFSSVGPTVGQELKDKSVWAILGVLIGIFAFVAWAFRKNSHPINSWKYGIVAILTLVHDVSIPAALFAVLGYLYGIEVETTFIVAILVVLGFSVNDTIVVFDRIRENLMVDSSKKKNLKETINRSVNETLMRSVNTSFTLIVVLVALLIYGPSSLFYFILTILVGTIAGTYSSIFVASPMLYLWGKK